MNTISHADLKQLAADQTDRCVSLYLPTGSLGRATAENSVRFKVLVDIASKSLGKQGMNVMGRSSLPEPCDGTSSIAHCFGKRSITVSRC